VNLIDDHPYAFVAHHADLRARAEAFAARARGPDERTGEGAIRTRVAALGAAGLLEHGIARDDTRAMAVIRDALAWEDPLDDLAFIIQELAGYPLQASGVAPDLLAEARRGEVVLCFALTEPDAGSDVRAIATSAVRHGETYRLTGVKHWISNAPEADVAVVFARHDEGVGAFLVERPTVEPQDVAGHSIGRILLGDTPARLLALRGLPLALGALERCRPTVGAAALGLARRAFHETCAHVRARTQFGAPLAALDVVRGRVATMALDVETAALACAHACWHRDHAPPGGRTGYTSALGKVSATEAAQRVIDTAVQLHGAAGVDGASRVQAIWRAARPLTIYEGSTDVLHTLVAARWLSADERAGGTR
jgi:acyl-CoA dehydrogenase